LSKAAKSDELNKFVTLSDLKFLEYYITAAILKRSLTMST